jgi:uncharacterized membrane protein YqaE (UPF0057 family)
MQCLFCKARIEENQGNFRPLHWAAASPTRRPKVGPNRRPETKRAQGPGSGDSASRGIRKTWGRPPVGVCPEVGFKGHFWQNIVLTLLGYIPGIIHAQYVILRH